MQMPNVEALQEKWAPILNHEGMDPIKDSHRRNGYRSPPGEPRTNAS